MHFLVKLGADLAKTTASAIAARVIGHEAIKLASWLYSDSFNQQTQEETNV